MDTIFAEGMGPEELVLEKVTSEEYCEAAEKIVPDGRELVFRLIEGLTVSEAARCLNKSQGTIYSRKTILKKRLKIFQ